MVSTRTTSKANGVSKHRTKRPNTELNLSNDTFMEESITTSMKSKPPPITRFIEVPDSVTKLVKKIVKQEKSM